MSATPAKDVTDPEMSYDEVRHEGKRVRLKVVVDSCVKKWFKEYLLAAEQGDREMQLVVGAMFNTGYGVQRDPVKGRFWLAKARTGYDENHQDQHNQ
eukprot:c40940_g1_i1 orf=175-465(-)